MLARILFKGHISSERWWEGESDPCNTTWQYASQAMGRQQRAASESLLRFQSWR